MVGNGVSASRASLRMSSELRSIAHTLRTDLNGITVETVPPVKVDSDSGYLEIIEGVGTDSSLGFTQLTGDIDDVLMFTTKSMGKPFVGKIGSAGELIESPYAEVAWYCEPATNQPIAIDSNGDGTKDSSLLYNLHRRQLLVMDYVGAGSFHGTNSINGSMPTPLPTAYADNDLSLRRVPGTSRLLPNGLSDLTKRKNRFLHNFTGVVSAGAFPYNNVMTNLPANGSLSGNRLGEDIVLSNVLAFDVRVFDPAAEVLNNATAGVAVVPGDSGYSACAYQFSPTIFEGAYVDLGHGAATGSLRWCSSQQVAGEDIHNNNVFNSGEVHNQTMAFLIQRGSLKRTTHGAIIMSSMESMKISRYGVDQKNNMIDDDSNGIIDDANELETSPPYPVPLRGLEVTDSHLRHLDSAGTAGDGASHICSTLTTLMRIVFEKVGPLRPDIYCYTKLSAKNTQVSTGRAQMCRSMPLELLDKLAVLTDNLLM